MRVRQRQRDDVQHCPHSTNVLPTALILMLCLVTPASARADASGPGAMLDVGLPDGAVGSLVFRPLPAVLVHAGVGHNLSGAGFRTGVHLRVPTEGFAPHLALEAGHYLVAETPGWLRRVSRRAGLEETTLERVGYDYANGHLGAYFGTNALKLYVQGGVSWLRAHVRVSQTRQDFTPPIDVHQDATLEAWIVSGRGGILYFF